MKLKFNVKSLGKKRPYLEQQLIELPIQQQTNVEELLMTIVSQQVDAFNNRNERRNLCIFLTEGQIVDSGEAGKVRFGERYNDIKANKEAAKEVVLTAFEDGLIALFLNEYQLESTDEAISISELDEVTLIRLTFLTGSIW